MLAATKPSEYWALTDEWTLAKWCCANWNNPWRALGSAIAAYQIQRPSKASQGLETERETAAGASRCFERQTGECVHGEAHGWKFICVLPEPGDWINNTIDIPLMKSRSGIHNYFIVVVMRAASRCTVRYKRWASSRTTGAFTPDQQTWSLWYQSELK